VLRLEARRAVQIGDGARDLQNAMIRPRRQPEPGDRGLEQRVRAVRDAAMGADVARREGAYDYEDAQTGRGVSRPVAFRGTFVP
jgi:hypothetical protein